MLCVVNYSSMNLSGVFLMIRQNYSHFSIIENVFIAICLYNNEQLCWFCGRCRKNYL